jgi:hypothetical protein
MKNWCVAGLNISYLSISTRQVKRRTRSLGTLVNQVEICEEFSASGKNKEKKWGNLTSICVSVESEKIGESLILKYFVGCDFVIFHSSFFLAYVSSSRSAPMKYPTDSDFDSKVFPL